MARITATVRATARNSGGGDDRFDERMLIWTLIVRLPDRFVDNA